MINVVEMPYLSHLLRFGCVIFLVNEVKGNADASVKKNIILRFSN